MNVVGQMWMRGEQLKSSLLSFSLQIQRENGETEIVSGMKKRNTRIYLISIIETYFERLNKDKRTTGFMGPLTCRIKDSRAF